MDNFVHADLHPGNILYAPPPSGSSSGWRKEPALGFVDAGLVVELSPRDQRNFVLLFHAIAMGDGERAADLMLNNAPQVRLCRWGERGRGPMGQSGENRAAAGSLGVGLWGSRPPATPTHLHRGRVPLFHGRMRAFSAPWSVGGSPPPPHEDMHARAATKRPTTHTPALWASDLRHVGLILPSTRLVSTSASTPRPSARACATWCGRRGSAQTEPSTSRRSTLAKS